MRSQLKSHAQPLIACHAVGLSFVIQLGLFAHALPIVTMVPLLRSVFRFGSIATRKRPGEIIRRKCL